MWGLQSQTHSRYVVCLGKRTVNNKTYSGALALCTCWKHLQEIWHFYDVLWLSVRLQFLNNYASAAGRLFSTVIHPNLRWCYLFFGTACMNTCTVELNVTAFEGTRSRVTAVLLEIHYYKMLIHLQTSVLQIKKKKYIKKFWKWVVILNLTESLHSTINTLTMLYSNYKTYDI
jgi:hypothetical protein